jgi:hypothetical protein
MLTKEQEYSTVLELVQESFKKYGYTCKFMDRGVQEKLGKLKKAHRKGPPSWICKIRNKHISRTFQVMVIMEPEPSVVIKALKGTQDTGLVRVSDPKFKDRLFYVYMQVHATALLGGFYGIVAGLGVKKHATRLQHLLDEVEMLVPLTHNRVTALKEVLNFDFKPEVIDLTRIAANMPPRKRKFKR